MSLTRLVLKGSIIFKSYSTATEQVIKVPLDVFGTRGRYATSLYTAAIKMNELDCVDLDLCELRNALKKSPKLLDLLRSPFIARNKMAEVLKTAAKDLEFAKCTQNFLEVVATNGRLKILPQIIESFEEIMIAHRREVHCNITTAKPLDAGELTKIEEALRKFVKSDQHIVLQTNVDPSIIGGMAVSIGDYFIDLSISKKIEMYKNILNAPLED